MSDMFHWLPWVGKANRSGEFCASILYSRTMITTSTDLRSAPSGAPQSPNKSSDSETSSGSTPSGHTRDYISAFRRDIRRDSFEDVRHDSPQVYGYGEFLDYASPYAPLCKSFVRAGNEDYRSACHPILKYMKDCFGYSRKEIKA